MNVERVRELLLALPDVVETQQWGDNLVFWVGDKAIGGKMFCVLNLGAVGQKVISYAAGAERYSELLEREGLFPAPYMARIYWVAVERWGALRDSEWSEELQGAYTLTREKLPPKVKRVLEMPKKEQQRLIKEGRAKKAAKAK